jgi:CheY-like chemotaxis protein
VAAGGAEVTGLRQAGAASESPVPWKGGKRMARSFTPLAGIHLAIVEDNDDSRYLLTEVLQYCGAPVTPISSAEEALTFLGHVRADILVSDHAMPGIDGYELIRTVRKLPAGRGAAIPAIAITAFEEDYDSDKAYQAGFNAYVKTPIDLTAFCEVVASLVVDRSRVR